MGFRFGLDWEWRTILLAAMDVDVDALHEMRIESSS